MKPVLIRKTTALALGTGGICLMATMALADQVILDDLIVDGSACIGFDCVNGESFGFDTLRLKENNLRIKAQDTSSSASFPSNDWQITFNDSANGGANKFSIDDIDGGRTPFTIEAGAPSHSLYVDDGGRLGLGTSTPVVDVHVKTGNTPTLRLEQDGSSGFTPQTWDVAGNEANFFIRDATNGSTLPFRIFPGAPSNALTIEASTGDVGIGTTSPDAALHVVGSGLLLDQSDIGTAAGSALHVRRSDGTGKLLVQESHATVSQRRMVDLENNGGLAIVMLNTSNGVKWSVVNQNSAPNAFLITNADGAGDDFVLDSSGNLALLGTITTTGGTCGGGCDRVFDAEYERISIQEHGDLMWENSYLPNVGPTVENAPINISDKLGRMLNELEYAHIYIEQMHERMEASQSQMAAMQARIESLEDLPQSQN